MNFTKEELQALSKAIEPEKIAWLNVPLFFEESKDVITCGHQMEGTKSGPIMWLFSVHGRVARRCYHLYAKYDFEGWLFADKYVDGQFIERKRFDSDVELHIKVEASGGNYVHKCGSSNNCNHTDKVYYTPLPTLDQLEPGEQVEVANAIGFAELLSACGRATLTVVCNFRGTTYRSREMSVG